MIECLLYVIVGAAQEVYLGNWFQSVDPILVLFISFFLTAAFFIAINIGNLNSLMRKVHKYWQWIVLINLSTTVGWVGFFLALKTLEPAVVSTLSFAIGPLLTLFFWQITGIGFRPTKAEVLTSIGVATGLCILVYVSLSGQSGIGDVQSGMRLALLYGFLSGVGVAGNTIFSKQLSRVGFSTTEVLSSRFVLLVVTAGLFAPVQLSSHIDGLFLLKVFVITILTIVGPVFLLQRGIEKTKPLLVSVLLSSMPVATYFFQILDSRIEMSPYTLVGILLTITSIITGILSQFSGDKETFSEEV